MIVHSDSGLGFLLAMLLTLAAAVAFLVSVVFAANREYRSAAKVAAATLGCMVAWVMVVTLISFLTPRTIVKVGNTYCEDIRCIGIDMVHAEANGAETIYTLDVHLFSDANTVKVSFGNVYFVLVDERGRRFPTMDSRGEPTRAYDMYLEPQQTVKTTLTFSV